MAREGKSEENNQDAPDIVTEIGELPLYTVISETGLARIFGRHRVSVKRQVAVDHLPPPIRLFGAPVWTIHWILKMGFL